MAKSRIKYNFLLGLTSLSAIILMLTGLGCCGEVAPPCSSDAFVLEPMPMTTEYTDGPMLDAGMYNIWSGEQKSDGSIAWKTYGPVQLKGKTSYVFDPAKRNLVELNPRNVETYPSQAVVTLKCVHYDPYGVCFEKVKPAVGPGGSVEWPISAGGNGHYYEAVLVPGGITWNDAKDAAEKKGGHLVTITSEAENQFVYNLVAGDDRYWTLEPTKNGEGPWLGGYQPSGSPEPAGGWTWVTGEPFSYTNWHAGEPNNGGGLGYVEDNLVFFGPMTLKSPAWNDCRSDFNAKGYIIETDSDTSEKATSIRGKPAKEQGYPQIIHECENGICGTWTLQGNQYIANWENGATAVLIIEKWDSSSVVVTRSDPGGSSAGLSARYEGQLNGNKIENGKETWTYHGENGSGTWDANW